LKQHGWTLLAWAHFEDQYARLVKAVQALREADPEGYSTHGRAKLLAAINHLILDVIPSDPGAAAFQQGNTLGPSHHHWFRAKFYGRFRLFYRFHSRHKIIVYAFMNDESTQRKAGARTDPYHVFRRMLESGSPPGDFDELMKQSRDLRTW
jgi:toxin YhaV